MLQDLTPSNRKFSDDPAEQALCAHIGRWTLAYGLALMRFLRDRESTSIDVLTDFAWDKGVLDLVAPLEFETREALHKAGTGWPWANRLDPDLYWRLMYAACAEKAVSADSSSAGDPRHNPTCLVVATTAGLLGLLTKPKGGSDCDPLANLFPLGATKLGSALLQGLLNQAAHQVRLRTGRSVTPKPLIPVMRVKVGDLAALVVSHGPDGRVLLDRETQPADPQGLEWIRQPRSGRWQAWAMPWLIEPAL